MDKDTELIEIARKGDLAAFKKLVTKHKRNVYYLAYDMLRLREDAEDVSQEVFVKAFRSLKNFRGDSKFSSWLYRITVNTCLSLINKKNYSLRQNSSDIDEIVDTELEIKSPESFNPEKNTEAVFIKNHIDKAMQKLSERERTIFIMRNYTGMSFDEIVNILKIKPGTVRSTNFKALEKLRRELSFYKDEI